jgi:hypothetical protein
MMSGMKRHRGRRQHLPEKEHGEPPRALAHQRAESRAPVRKVERLHTAQLLDVFGGFFVHDVEDIVRRHDAAHAALGIDDREGPQVMSREQACDFLLIQVFGHSDDVASHRAFDRLLVGCEEELLEGDRAEQALVGPDDVGVVDRFPAFLGLASQIAERLVRAHIRGHPRIARVHQATGHVFRIGEQGTHIVPSGRVEQREKLGSPFGRDLLQQVRRVVRRKQSHPSQPLPFRESQDENGLPERRSVQEEGLRGVPAELAEPLHLLLRIEERPELEELIGGDRLLRSRARSAHREPPGLAQSRTASGRGEVHTFSIIHQVFRPELAERVPYNVVVVELEEGPFFHSNVVDCANEAIYIGMPVEVVFDDVMDEVTLPRFRPR